MPPDTPALPVPHYLWSRIWGGVNEEFPYLGESPTARQRWDNGRLSVPIPPAVMIGGPSCDGFSGLTTSPAPVALVGGIDPRVYLAGGVPVPDWEVPVSTADRLQKAGVVTGTFTDSRINDTGAGCITVGACLDLAGALRAPYLDLAVGVAPAERPEEGRIVLYMVAGGRVYFLTYEGEEAPLLPSVAGGIPRGNATGDGYEPSRMTDPGSGAILIGADIQGPAGGIVFTGGTSPGAGIMLRPTTDLTGGPVALWPGSYLLLPILPAVPAAPEGYVAIGMTAAGLAATGADGLATSPVECGWCGVDGGDISTTPGSDCDGAAELEWERTYSFNHPGGAAFQWFTIPLTPGNDYWIEILSNDGTNLFLHWIDCASCAVAASQSVDEDFPGEFAWPLPAINARAFLYVADADAGSGGNYSFILHEGALP